MVLFSHTLRFTSNESDLLPFSIKVQHPDAQEGEIQEVLLNGKKLKSLYCQVVGFLTVDIVTGEPIHGSPTFNKLIKGKNGMCNILDVFSDYSHCTLPKEATYVVVNVDNINYMYSTNHTTPNPAESAMMYSQGDDGEFHRFDDLLPKLLVRPEIKEMMEK